MWRDMVELVLSCMPLPCFPTSLALSPIMISPPTLTGRDSRVNGPSQDRYRHWVLLWPLKVLASPLKQKSPKDLRKSLAERRLAVTKLMAALTLAEHASIKSGDNEGAENARERWNKLHSARYLMSPFADAYRSSGASMRHAKKSQFVSALSHLLSDKDNGAIPSELRASHHMKKCISYYYDFQMPQYRTVMIGIMNHIWRREERLTVRAAILFFTSLCSSSSTYFGHGLVEGAADC